MSQACVETAVAPLPERAKAVRSGLDASDELRSDRGPVWGSSFPAAWRDQRLSNIPKMTTAFPLAITGGRLGARSLAGSCVRTSRI